MKLRTDSKQSESLRSLLSIDLDNSAVTVCLASLSNQDQNPVFERLILSDSLAADFRNVVRERFTDLSRDISEGELSLYEYEAGSKLDVNEVEHVDLQNQGTIKSQFASLETLASVGRFTETEEFISGLRFYVIIVQPPEGPTIYCFRAYSPKKELGRSKWFGALFTDDYFDRVNKPMFLFDQYIDCVSRDDDLFIIKKDAFQKIFRFFEMVRQAAKSALAMIRKAIPIDRFEEFEKACEGHLQKLAKINNIASKPYLKKVTMADIKKVIKEFSLPINTTKREGKELLVFDPSDKWALLRLLDDDYLGSVMTGQNYEVTSKRVVE
jgi:hypothetical protein